MAYGPNDWTGYNPTWRPQFTQPVQSPYSVQMQRQQTNIITVYGPESAKSMTGRLGPNSSMLYTDSNRPLLYLVETDGNGYPKPLRTFTLTEVIEEEQNPQENKTLENYVTKEDLETFKNEMLDAITGGAKDEPAAKQQPRKR